MKDKFSRRSVLICILLCAAALLASIWSIKNSYSNRARVDNAVALYKSSSMNIVARDSLLNELEMMKVKEDYFIDQVGIQSDWFIAYVSILFVIFGFIGFGVFDNQFKRMRDENEKHLSEYDLKVKNIQSNFNDLEDQLIKDYNKLKMDIGLTMGVAAYHNSKMYLESKHYSLSVDQYIKFIKYPLERLLICDENEKEGIINQGIENLRHLHVNLKNLMANRESREQIIRELNCDRCIGDLDGFLKYESRTINDSVMEVRPIFVEIRNAKPTMNLP